MPETRFYLVSDVIHLPRFRHCPLSRGLGFLGLHRRPMIDYFSNRKNCNFYNNISTISFDCMAANSERH